MDIYVAMILCKILSRVQLISWYFVPLFYRIVALLLKLWPCGLMCPRWLCFCQVLLFLQRDVTNRALHIRFYSGDENLFFVINHYIRKYWIAEALKAVCANHLNIVIIILFEDCFNYWVYFILILYIMSGIHTSSIVLKAKWQVLDFKSLSLLFESSVHSCTISIEPKSKVSSRFWLRRVFASKLPIVT